MSKCETINANSTYIKTLSSTKYPFNMGDELKSNIDSSIFVRNVDKDKMFLEFSDGSFGYHNRNDTDVFTMVKECPVKIREDEQVATASDRQVSGNHYSKLKIQPMKYSLENELNYGQANAIKYITRYKDKNGIEDLKKAIHCIELLIQHEGEGL